MGVMHVQSFSSRVGPDFPCFGKLARYSETRPFASLRPWQNKGNTDLQKRACLKNQFEFQFVNTSIPREG